MTTIQEAMITAAYRPIEDVPGFLLPLCNAGPPWLVQVANEMDIITAFESVTFDEDDEIITLPDEQQTQVQLGGIAIFTFALGNEIFVGTRDALVEVLKPRLPRLAAYPDLLFEVAQFVTETEQRLFAPKQAISGTKSKSPTNTKRKGGSNEIKRLMRRLQPIPGREQRRRNFSKDLQTFIENIPSAIEEEAKVSHRTQSDILGDMCWALGHDTQDLRQLIEEQISVANSGNLKEIWIANKAPLDFIPEFFVSTQQMLRDHVSIRYFLQDDQIVVELANKIARDRKLGPQYLAQVSACILQGDTSDGLLAHAYALENPSSADCEGRIYLGDPSLILRSGTKPRDVKMLGRFTRIEKRQALSYAALLRYLHDSGSPDMIMSSGGDEINIRRSNLADSNVVLFQKAAKT